MTVDNCTEGDTRLVGHLSDYQGLVEVCIDRNYRRVTTDSIFGLTTIIAASLVCVQLDIPRGRFINIRLIIMSAELKFVSSLHLQLEFPSYRNHCLRGCISLHTTLINALVRKVPSWTALVPYREYHLVHLILEFDAKVGANTEAEYVLFHVVLVVNTCA